MTLELSYSVTNQLMEGYRDFLLYNNRPKYKIKTFVNMVRKLQNYIGKSYVDISKNDIQNYLKYLKEVECHKYDSVYRHLITIKQFYNYLIFRGTLVNNPCESIRIKRF